MFIGDNAKAADAMKKAVELNPHDHRLWRNLGDSYRQVPALQNQAPATYQKALEVAQEGLKVNPKDREAMSGVALYEAHLGNKAAARNDIAKALQEAPRDSDVMFTAALVYELIGERKQALTSLRDSLKAGFSVEDAKREPELKALRSDPGYGQMIRATQPHSD
jgi:serine/threonine-protein kinase